MVNYFISLFALQKTDRQDTELRKRRSSPGFFARLRVNCLFPYTVSVGGHNYCNHVPNVLCYPKMILCLWISDVKYNTECIRQFSIMFLKLNYVNFFLFLVCVCTLPKTALCAVSWVYSGLFVAGKKLSLAIYMATVKQTNSTKKGARRDQ